MTAPIRVMTWNVHSTLHLNPGFDLAGVIELIRRWKPDIVALQEIDSRGRAESPFDALEKAIGGHAFGVKSIVADDGEYGQMLISRWPWASTPKVADISYLEREPRRAVTVDIETPHGCLHVIGTHLGLSVRERQDQVTALIRLAKDTKHPAIVLGDFNDWFWVNTVRGALREHFPVRTRHRTFPAVCPMMRLDRVYASRRIAIGQSFVDKAGRRLSDHLPVIADIAILSS